ncbi:hypothetical protein [Acinetobacter sp. WZC-1]|uniref:hypothetical protein n=1 Tax=Acinetobacter sp. WZC-1 TaxID=3459034 RepID=UPI00403D5594
MDAFRHIDWQAWGLTLALIIFFREASVLLMSQFNHPELGNLTGLLSLLLVLTLWRRFKKIPPRLVDTNNKLMKESSFAFLPISAGSLLMLVTMGKQVPLFLLVLLISTLIPLWVYARMARKWL